MDKKIETEEQQNSAEKPSGNTADNEVTTVHTVQASTSKVASRKKLLIIGIAVAVVLAGIGVATWYFLAGPGAQTSESTSDDNSTVSIAPYEEHMAAVLNDVKGEVAIASTVTSLGGQTTSGALVYDFAPYQVTGTSFKVLPATGNGTAVAVENEAAALAALKSAEGLLIEKGAMKRISDSTADAGGLASQSLAQVVSYAIYRSNDSVCSLAHLAAAGAHMVSIGCADTKEYESAASAVKPFVDAYAKANPAKTDGAQIFSAPDIKDGSNGTKQVTLYQRVSGQTAAGGASLYYQAKNSTEWQFIGGGYTGTIPCKIFVSSDQKAAFKGGFCYDEATKKERAI